MTSVNFMLLVCIAHLTLSHMGGVDIMYEAGYKLGLAMMAWRVGWGPKAMDV